MNALLFPANKSVELSFKVGIAGTGSIPSRVAVVLERDTKSLSFNAIKDGDSWKAIIENPGSTFGVGEVRMSISVLLNNHLFTPLKTSAEIVEVQAEPQIDSVPAPVVEVQTNPEPPVPVLRTQAPALPKIDVPLTTIEKPVRLSLLKSIEPSIAPKLPVQRAPIQIKEATGTPFSIKKSRTVFK